LCISHIFWSKNAQAALRTAVAHLPGFFTFAVYVPDEAEAEARAELEKRLDWAGAKNRLLPRTATAFFAKSERFADAWAGGDARHSGKLRGAHTL
jgi:hypothetical protein